MPGVFTTLFSAESKHVSYDREGILPTFLWAVIRGTSYPKRLSSRPPGINMKRAKCYATFGFPDISTAKVGKWSPNYAWAKFLRKWSNAAFASQLWIYYWHREKDNVNTRDIVFIEAEDVTSASEMITSPPPLPSPPPSLTTIHSSSIWECHIVHHGAWNNP